MEQNESRFDPETFLAQAGLGRKSVHLSPGEIFFSQGDAADCVFFLRSGRAKLTVISDNGKEVTIALLAQGDFAGEEAMSATSPRRIATATALTACTALRLERDDMVRAQSAEREFCNLFLQFLLSRLLRAQSDLIDQLFNSSERRLARQLLLLAELADPADPQPKLPRVTHEALAEMAGTTRARVSFFMNRFRKMGLLEYSGTITVNKARLSAMLLH